MKKNIVLLAGVVFLVATMAFAQDSGVPWTRASAKDGVVGYTRSSSEPNVVEFKAIGIVKAPVAVVESMLRDFTAWKDFMFMAKESRLIEAPGFKNSADSRYFYFRQGLPWPVSDRDSVAKIDFFVKQNGEVRLLVKDVPGDVLLTKGVIRMPLVEQQWILKPVPEGTEVTYENRASAGGSLPTSVINLILKVMGPNTLINIRELVKQSKYQSKSIVTVTPLMEG